MSCAIRDTGYAMRDEGSKMRDVRLGGSLDECQGQCVSGLSTAPSRLPDPASPQAIFCLVLTVAVCAASSGCPAVPKPPVPSPPATVAKPLKEEQLNTITLTAEAVQRLALRTAQVERKATRRTRIYGGEVSIPVGQSILVSAPVSGILKLPPGGMPVAGQAVKRGQTLFQLAPLLTPEGRTNLASTKIEAEGQLKTAQTQFEAARIALDRAQRMLAGQTGSQRSVDEAQALFDLAQQAVAAATSRCELLEKLAGEIEQGTTAPLSIDSPLDGLLRNVAALPGEDVPAGGLLFEVVNLDRVWVRVPVYVGDLAEVAATADAGIGDLAMRPGSAQRWAKPIHAPPTANAMVGTVDLYYELDNRDESYWPGQRVGAALTLKSEAESLTVPWSAVIQDIHGGSWVYEQTGDGTYVRRRVAVEYVVDDTAVLAFGPPPGRQVVAAGAAELFGTETGFTK